MANGAKTFPLPELGTIPQNELSLYSLPAMLSAALSDDSVMEDLVERASQQSAPPPLEALQFGAAAGLQPQASQVPLGPVQARVQGALDTAAGGPERPPAPQQSPYPPQAPPPPAPAPAPAPAPGPTIGDRIEKGLSALGGAAGELGEAGPPQLVTPQARPFVSSGQPSVRSNQIVPGPNAQSHAYLQSLVQLLQGNRYG